MASLFKKKPGKPRAGQAPSMNEGGSDAPPPPPKKKKSLFGKKGPKQAKLGKQKPPKGQGKKLFGNKKDMPPAPPTQTAGDIPGAAASKEPAQEVKHFPSDQDSPQAPDEGQPSKKSIFTSKGARGPKPAKVESLKPPEGQKEIKPKEKKKKEKKPKGKKQKAPKGEKKSFLSFGKKSQTAVLGPQSGAPIQAPTGEPSPMMGVGPGDQDSSGKSSRSAVFGKKSPKGAGQPKPLKKKKSKSGGIGGSKTSPVGLDLGRTSLSAVRLRHQTGGSVLLSAALDNLPAGLIQEGEVKDVDGLAFALKDFWKTHKIKGRRVTIGLANQKVVVRTLEFPMLDEKELRSAIEFQAQDYIPIPIEEAVFDFHILGEVTSEEGIQKQRVLVVAAQKVMVMDFINAIKKAKLTVDGVDLQAFSMLRSLSESSFLEVEGERKEAIAIANIASDITNIVVTTDGEPQFTRIVAFGGDNFTKSIQDLQGSTYAEAEVLKAQIGLAAPGVMRPEEDSGGIAESTPEGAESQGAAQSEETGIIQVPPEPTSPQESGQDTEPVSEPPMMGTPETGNKPDNDWSQGPPDPESPEEIKKGIMRVLELTADALADEIRRSLDYYMSQEQSATVSKLVLSGGGAMLANLDLHLAQVFPFPVEIGNPLRRITQNRSGISDEALSALAPRLAIAIGLALEDEE
jgi:type IV pilus assembly protein PilM